jgi:hypothetical protein
MMVASSLAQSRTENFQEKLGLLEDATHHTMPYAVLAVRSDKLACLAASFSATTT